MTMTMLTTMTTGWLCLRMDAEDNDSGFLLYNRIQIHPSLTKKPKMMTMTMTSAIQLMTMTMKFVTGVFNLFVFIFGVQSSGLFFVPAEGAQQKRELSRKEQER